MTYCKETDSAENLRTKFTVEIDIESDEFDRDNMVRFLKEARWFWSPELASIIEKG